MPGALIEIRADGESAVSKALSLYADVKSVSPDFMSAWVQPWWRISANAGLVVRAYTASGHYPSG